MPLELYIISKKNINCEIENIYFLKLNRSDSHLEIYKKVNEECLRESYPIREDFDISKHELFALHKSMPCIYGGEGKRRTPQGFFNIEKVSSDEYISPYYPSRGQVKFFGYLVIFEDYFIHSDLYSVDANRTDFTEQKSISLGDKDTSGCIRVSQPDLDWLVKNIPVGTMMEL